MNSIHCQKKLRTETRNGKRAVNFVFLVYLVYFNRFIIDFDKNKFEYRLGVKKQSVKSGEKKVKKQGVKSSKIAILLILIPF